MRERKALVRKGLMSFAAEQDGEGVAIIGELGVADLDSDDMDALCAWWMGETLDQVAKRRKKWEAQHGTTDQ